MVLAHDCVATICSGPGSRVALVQMLALSVLRLVALAPASAAAWEPGWACDRAQKADAGPLDSSD